MEVSGLRGEKKKNPSLKPSVRVKGGAERDLKPLSPCNWQNDPEGLGGRSRQSMEGDNFGFQWMVFSMKVKNST